MTAHDANEPEDARALERADASSPRVHPWRGGRLRLILAVVIATSAAPRVARADDVAAAAAIARMSQRALEDYENLNFDEAHRRLRAALEECSRVGLSWHAVAAEAHLLMGVVLLAEGDRRRPEAVVEFQKAVEIQPAITLPERVANPEIQGVFSQAAKAAEPEPPVVETQAAGRPHQGAPAPEAAETDDLAGVSEAQSGPETAASPVEHAWLVGFSVGGGLGWTSGSGEVTDTRVASGFRPSSLGHLLPEVGYFVAPDLLLSLQLRVQFIDGATSEVDPRMTMCGSDHVCSPSRGATAILARASWFVGGGPRLRPYLSAVIGAGQIRHLTAVQGAPMCGTDPAHPAACVDTVAAGPVFVGPGAGLMVRLGHNFSLMAGANTLLGFPRFTFHLDLNGGVALEF
jgi:hypothetical protein